MLEAAQWLPSHYLTQPWYFICVPEPPKALQILWQILSNNQDSVYPTKL